MHCRASGLRVGLHGGRPAQDGRRPGGLRQQEMHRLPLLPVRLPLRRADLRLEQPPGADPQVPDVRGAAGRRRAAGLRVRLSRPARCASAAAPTCSSRRTPRSAPTLAATSTRSTASTRPAARRCSICPACPSASWACLSWATRAISHYAEAVMKKTPIVAASVATLATGLYWLHEAA